MNGDGREVLIRQQLRQRDAPWYRLDENDHLMFWKRGRRSSKLKRRKNETLDQVNRLELKIADLIELQNVHELKQPAVLLVVLHEEKKTLYEKKKLIKFHNKASKLTLDTVFLTLSLT